MSDPQQPSPEELQAYLAQLREADPGEIVAQAYTVLGTGAEVKLGRPDGRVLIDTMGALVDAAAAAMDTDLVTRMREGVGQLQLAQVQAERQQAGQPPPEGQPASTTAAGQGQADATPADQADQPDAKPGQPRTSGPQDRRMTDRLWIPGRDPGPAR